LSIASELVLLLVCPILDLSYSMIHIPEWPCSWRVFWENCPENEGFGFPIKYSFGIDWFIWTFDGTGLSLRVVSSQIKDEVIVEEECKTWLFWCIKWFSTWFLFAGEIPHILPCSVCSKTHPFVSTDWFHQKWRRSDFRHVVLAMAGWTEDNSIFNHHVAKIFLCYFWSAERRLLCKTHQQLGFVVSAAHFRCRSSQLNLPEGIGGWEDADTVDNWFILYRFDYSLWSYKTRPWKKRQAILRRAISPPEVLVCCRNIFGDIGRTLSTKRTMACGLSLSFSLFWSSPICPFVHMSQLRQQVILTRLMRALVQIDVDGKF